MIWGSGFGSDGGEFEAMGVVVAVVIGRCFYSFELGRWFNLC
jgi:hypothetical protein